MSVEHSEPRRRAGRIPPHNLDAEESLLGGMLLSRQAIQQASLLVLPGDFYKPAHGHIYEAIIDTYDRRQAVDPTTVADTLGRSDLLAAIGGRQALLQLQAHTPASANVPHYATIVGELAALRRAIALGGDLIDLAYEDPGPVGDVVTFAETIGERIAVPRSTVEPGIDAYELADMEFEYKWLVPGLIQRRDRIIVTGLEGHSGKTEFLVQLAIQFGCGIHPWTRQREFEPLRVLVVDCENRLDQLQPRVRRLMKVAGDNLPHGQVIFRSVDEINVRTPRGAGVLESLCEQHKPDVLICGALYAMFQGSKGMAKHSEEVAEEVAAFFRRLIARHDCTLLIEAHAPHGSDGDRAGLRPIGASLWLRWPEIGVGLAPKTRKDATSRRQVVVPGEFIFDFWRGTRDQDLRRPWPTGVRRWNTWSFIPIEENEF